jgi:hypothetical protein
VLLTHGRRCGPPREGEGWADLAGSETSGLHGNLLRGTREALHLAWQRGQVRTVHPRETTVLHGCRESDRCIGPRKPAHNGRPTGPAEEGEGRERAKGNVVQQSRGRTQSRVLPVTGARPRMAGIFGGLRVITRGRSPVRECRTPGSVRGAARKGRSYRDRL